MKRSRLLVALGVMVMALASTTGVASAKKIRTSNNLVLDSYEPNNDGFAGAVTSNRLPSGTHWIAEVQGTFNYYETARYASPSEQWPIICGTPDMTGPMFPSDVHPSYKGVGMDPEFIFARPWTQKRCDRHPLPKHWDNFQISRGAGFKHRTPLGTELLSHGIPAIAVDHKYLYPITGIGESAQFRLKDRPRTSDNYGALHIVVRAATAADCSVGYRDFEYADVADCQSQIASGPVAG